MIALPPDLVALVEGATWEQVTLGESGAQVYRLRASAETRYIKVEPRRPHGELQAEAERLHWLQGRLPVPALHYAGADESHSYMLTTEVPGADASDDSLHAEPDRLIVLLAESLLLIHCQPIVGCPFDQCLDAELARAAANVAARTLDIDDFDEERAGRSRASLLDELYATRPSDLAMCHRQEQDQWKGRYGPSDHRRHTHRNSGGRGAGRMVAPRPRYRPDPACAARAARRWRTSRCASPPRPRQEDRGNQARA